MAWKKSHHKCKDALSQTVQCAGHGIISAAKHFQYAVGKDQDEPEVLFANVAGFCNPKQHEAKEAYKFWKLPWNEGTFDQFLTLLQAHVETCNFGNMTDRLTSDKLLFTVPEALRQVLLRENELSLTRAGQICRSYNAFNM